VGSSQGSRHSKDRGGAALAGLCNADGNVDDHGNMDASPESDSSAPRNHPAAAVSAVGGDNSATAEGLQDTANSSTDGARSNQNTPDMGRYQEAADRLMDIEGLPHKYSKVHRA